MDSSGKLQYTVEYSTGFSDDSDIVTKAYVDEVIKSYKDYNDYLAKNVDQSVQYIQYVAEQLNTTIDTVKQLEKTTVKKTMTANHFFHDNTFEDY